MRLWISQKNSMSNSKADIFEGPRGADWCFGDPSLNVQILLFFLPTFVFESGFLVKNVGKKATAKNAYCGKKCFRPTFCGQLPTFCPLFKVKVGSDF